MPGRISAMARRQVGSPYYFIAAAAAVTGRPCKSYCRVYKYSGGPLLRRGIEP